MIELSPHEKKVAKNLLATLLPIAREKAATEKTRIEHRSAIAKSQQQYLTEANLRGVHIFRANTGGWIADIYFDNTPPWIPNAIGTPVGRPHKTEKEAIEQAIVMLAIVLSNNPGEKSTPVFALYDIVFDLPEQILEKIMGAQIKADEDHIGYGSIRKAVLRLEEILSWHFPNSKPSYEAFKNLSIDNQAQIMAVCTMCALSGLMRYPSPEPKVLP